MTLRPLKGSPRGRRATFKGSEPWLLGATADTALLGTHDGDAATIACVDKDLATRWSVPVKGGRDEPFARTGDALLRVEGRAVSRLDATGKVEARADLPLLARRLAVQGDRAVVALAGPKGAAVFARLDLVEKFGELAWRHELAACVRAEIALAGDRVAVSSWGHRAVALLDSASGAPQASFELGADEKLGALHAADEHGVLATVFRGEHGLLDEHSLEGKPLWRHDAPFSVVALAPGVVFGVTRDESGSAGEVLLALEREKGTIIWMHELGGRAPGLAPTHRLAMVEDVLYVGTAGAKISVTAHDVKTGATVFERAFPLPVDLVPQGGGPIATPAAFDMALLDERVVLAVGSEGETVLALLAN